MTSSAAVLHSPAPSMCPNLEPCLTFRSAPASCELTTFVAEVQYVSWTGSSSLIVYLQLDPASVGTLDSQDPAV